MSTIVSAHEPVNFQTHPDRYHHWKLSIDGDRANLVLDIQEDKPFRGDYLLKLNSYDLGVDIELADAIDRLRFEHPEVKVVVISSGKDRVFSAGANIRMLGQSDHGFKINFCKFTNETRLAMEDASKHSNLRFLAALNGITAGGGYELALACDDLVLVDDDNSAVSLPEVPLLGVLPGTGGLTRVVDKRKVRRDLADIFCTLSEGVKGKRAVDWGLVDAIAPRSKFEDVVNERTENLKSQVKERSGKGIEWSPVTFTEDGPSRTYEYVTLKCDLEERTATITIQGPGTDEPASAGDFREKGVNSWALRAFRELDNALLHLRFNMPECGLILIKTHGVNANVLAVDNFLNDNRDDWYVNEVLTYQARVLRRLDLMAKSIFALIEPRSCFAGCLFELALAADRSYLLDDDNEDRDKAPEVALGPLNAGTYPMTHCLSRLEVRYSGDQSKVDELIKQGTFDPQEAEDAGLVTFVLDDIDYEDEVRVAIEERASLSPDALTGMEASLRFPGSENCDSKIFGRLSAWQNWIFFRPNAVGEKGALKLYGQPTRPEFDWKRT